MLTSQTRTNSSGAAPNGRIVADGSEAYSSKGHALRAAKKIAKTPIVIKSDEAHK